MNFHIESHQAASRGCQRPEGSEPLELPEEVSNLFFQNNSPIFSFEPISEPS
jgi:hypothetical protein